MTSFVENPQDYLGAHRYHSTAPVFQVCDCHEVCGATFRVDDVAPDTGHEAKHAAVPGFPYLVYQHGIKVQEATR
jgi:hypothetical protein